LACPSQVHELRCLTYLWGLWLGCLWSGWSGWSSRSGATFFELVEVGSDLNGVALGGKVTLDDTSDWGGDIDGDFVSLNPCNDFVGLDEFSGTCRKRGKQSKKNTWNSLPLTNSSTTPSEMESPMPGTGTTRPKRERKVVKTKSR